MSCWASGCAFGDEQLLFAQTDGSAIASRGPSAFSSSSSTFNMDALIALRLELEAGGCEGAAAPAADDDFALPDIFLPSACSSFSSRSLGGSLTLKQLTLDQAALRVGSGTSSCATPLGRAADGGGLFGPAPHDGGVLDCPGLAGSSLAAQLLPPTQHGGGGCGAVPNGGVLLCGSLDASLLAGTAPALLQPPGQGAAAQRAAPTVAGAAVAAVAVATSQLMQQRAKQQQHVEALRQQMEQAQAELMLHDAALQQLTQAPLGAQQLLDECQLAAPGGLVQTPGLPEPHGRRPAADHTVASLLAAPAAGAAAQRSALGCGALPPSGCGLPKGAGSPGLPRTLSGSAPSLGQLSLRASSQAADAVRAPGTPAAGLRVAGGVPSRTVAAADAAGPHGSGGAAGRLAAHVPTRPAPDAACSARPGRAPEALQQAQAAPHGEAADPRPWIAPCWAGRGWDPRAQVAQAQRQGAAAAGTGAFIPGTSVARPGGTGAFLPPSVRRAAAAAPPAARPSNKPGRA